MSIVRRRLLRLAPVLALAVGLTAACADEQPTLPSNLPPIPTALPSGLPTSTPPPAPPPAPSGEPQGTPLGYEDALLQPHSLPVESTAGENASCDDVVDKGWVVDDCGAVANYA